jgi:hypothetical protein
MFKKLLFLFSVLALSLYTVACGDDDEPFENVKNFNELPQQAQSFINDYFSTYNISSIVFSEGGYEVNFDNGTEVDFNAVGQWTDIDAGLGYYVPFELVPLGISTYLSTNYPTQNITELSRTVSGGYVVDLTNGAELIFDVNGNFIGYD